MTDFGWNLPPGVTDRMIDEASGAYEEPKPCDCEEECDCDGPVERTTMPLNRPAGAQDAKAFAALDALPAGDRLPLQALFERLAKFGHSDQWALKLASEWYRSHSRLWTGPRD
jgi:hypothetical protein